MKVGDKVFLRNPYVIITIIKCKKKKVLNSGNSVDLAHLVA